MPRHNINFLTELSAKKEICKLVSDSVDTRIAVAFWGDGAAKALGLDRISGARIICNLTLGGTNPSEIRQIMKRHRVKEHAKLHAKVYWTPSGVVVGSSNASTNGFSDIETAGWREANVAINARDLVGAVGEWFDSRWRESGRITKPRLRQAEEAYKRRRRFEDLQKLKRNVPRSAQTLLATAKTNPDLLMELPIYLIFYDLPDTVVARTKAKELTRKPPSEALESGIATGANRAWLYEEFNGTLPVSAWLIDCDMRNSRRPQVWGIGRTLPKPIKEPLSDGEERWSADVAFRQRWIDLGDGVRLQFPPKERAKLQTAIKKALGNSLKIRKNNYTVVPFQKAISWILN